MWLNGGVVAIGPGRALMRGRNVAMPTILNPSHANASLGCIGALPDGFSIALDSRLGCFLVDKAGSQGHFPPPETRGLRV